MCRCKYPRVVKRRGINLLEDEKGERCYKITFELGTIGSKVLVISRAPKKVEENSCDCMYKRIIKFLEINEDEIGEIQELTIVNLFTLYEYSKEDLYEKCLSEGRRYIEGNDEYFYNDEIIAEEIHNADYILAAWGNPLESLEEIYVERVELVLKSLRHEIFNSSTKKHVVRVGEASKKGYPKHSLAWSYNDEMKNLFE